MQQHLRVERRVFDLSVTQRPPRPVADMLGLVEFALEFSRADGAEVFYAETVARDFGMAATGGSDWHGLPAEGPLGSFAVEFEKVAEFFARLDGCAPAARKKDGPGGRD